MPSFLFLWNAFTPQQYYSLLVVPSFLLYSLKLKLLCIFPRNILGFFSPHFSPLILRGQISLILRFFNSAKKFAFQCPKVFSVYIDDISSIYFNFSTLHFKKVHFVYWGMQSLQFWKNWFLPQQFCWKNLSSLQHNLFSSNYQYKNKLRLAIRLQLSFILFFCLLL